MSYSKISGGDYTHLEIGALTETSEIDPSGVINTPMAMLALKESATGLGKGMMSLLKAFELPETLLGPGRYKFHKSMSKTAYTRSLRNQEWNGDLINKHNLDKTEFANAGFGVTAGVLAMVLLVCFGGPAVLGATRVGSKAVSAIGLKRRHAELMTAVQDVAPVERPPIIANTAKSEIALALHITGMLQNNKAQLNEALKVLQNTK